MTIANPEPSPAALRLGERLRELREREFVPLTQTDLGRAFGHGQDTVSPAAISTWENPKNGRVVPHSRLQAYAQLFCTPRSFEGGSRMLSLAELTAEEHARLVELRQELISLRDRAVPDATTPALVEARSMWHFPDGSRITVACYRLPADRRPAHADPASLDYVRSSNLADLDTLIDVHGAVRAANPSSQIVITAAQDLTPRDVATHLVLIGGMIWDTVAPWFSRIFQLPIKREDPGNNRVIAAKHSNDKIEEFKYQIDNGTLVEDVGFFARGENPSAPQRTLTICGGITTRGVRGAAQCFIDWEMQERNEQFIKQRFPGTGTYCIVMKVPVVNDDPLTPDLSKPENRLFEWCDDNTKAD